MGMLTPNTFGAAMDKLRIAVRQGLVHPKHGTLSHQGQKLLQKIIELTAAHGAIKSDTATIQYRAIAGDVYRLVHVVPSIVMSAIEKMPGRGSLNNVWLHDSKLGVHMKLQGSGYFKNVAELEAFHRTRYTYRGRVHALPYASRYYVSRMVVAEFLARRLNPRAGKAKAGWLPAATALFVPNLPRYAFRHSPGQGYFIDGRQAPRPFIEARNTSRWSRNGYEAQRIVTNAIRFRSRDMESYFAKTMQGAVTKAGLAG